MTKRPVVIGPSSKRNEILPLHPSSFDAADISLSPPEHEEEQESMPDRISRVSADERDLKHFYNIEISSTRFARLKEYYKAELKDLETAPFEFYDQQSKVDYLLLKNYLKRCLRQLDLDREKDKLMEKLLPFAETIIKLCEARQKTDPVQGQEVGRDMAEICRVAAAVRAKIIGGEEVFTSNVSRETAYRASKTVQQLREHLQEYFDFYAGYDPVFTWWVKADHEKADHELHELSTTILEQLVGIKPGSQGAIVGEPIGREGLLAELNGEMIPYTPEELIRIAENEERWCISELKKASDELGYGNNWKGALEYVKSKYVQPGMQPQLVNELLHEGAAYMKQHDLVTVPPLAEETWRMFMLSPEAQQVSPFFLGGDSILVAYPTDAMDYSSKLMTMRGNNRHFSRATVFHEMIPGHHLQFHMLERYKPYRKLFDTPFWIEGWALYWEYILWDKSFFRTPEDRIGTLFWRMHRCARILFSLNFHLGTWTPQQCIEYLVEHVGHERSTAEGEVRRSFAGDYSPLYQSAYMLGALQIYALRHEVVDSGDMQEKAFHDTVLRQNFMPIDLLRALLTRDDLSRDFEASWRFYDSPIRVEQHM